jgi:hypothetical protein
VKARVLLVTKFSIFPNDPTEFSTLWVLCYNIINYVIPIFYLCFYSRFADW